MNTIFQFAVILVIFGVHVVSGQIGPGTNPVNPKLCPGKQGSNCLSTTATFTCPPGGILFSITPGPDRVGKISVYGQMNTQGCSVLTSGRNYQLFIPIVNPAQPPCGIKLLANGNFGATFVTQALPNLYTTIDRKYEVACALGQELDAESAPVSVTGSVLNGNVMQQTSEVKLEIRDIGGNAKHTSLGLGQLAILYMYLPNTSVLKGMDVDTCTAYDATIQKGGPAVSEAIELFKRGCGTNTIFSSDQGFTQAQGKPPSHMVSPAFEMFRFITTNTVVIECTFTRFCTVENDPDCAMSCPFSFNNTRVRRSAAPTENIYDKIVTQIPMKELVANATTTTVVQVFSEEDLAAVVNNEAAFNNSNIAKAPTDEVCVMRNWFILGLCVLGSVLVTLALFCFISCYKLRRNAPKSDNSDRFPVYVKNVV